MLPLAGDPFCTAAPTQGGLAKSQVRVGDRVGFEARAGDLLYGEVIRLNRKTVTLEVEGEGQWRVAYSLLFPVIEHKRPGRN